MTRRLILTFSVAGWLAGLAVSANAVELEKIAGRTIEIKERDFEKVLTVDGRELHTNAIIFLDDIYAFDGTVVVVGTSSVGGNACEGAPFVLSFPDKGAPRIDGPLDSCTPVSHAVEGSTLLFSTASVPGRDTERWQWSVDRGMTPLAPVAFQPDEARGWSNLRERTFTHPSDAFNNAEIAASFKMVLGSDFTQFQQLMAGVGSGQFKGDDFVGTACRPHACLDEAGLIYLSSSDRRAYAAWKPHGERIAVFPAPVTEWPEKARAELKEWAKQWP